MIGSVSEVFRLLFRIAALIVVINLTVLFLTDQEITMQAVFSPLFMKEKIQFMINSLITWFQTWA